MFAGRLGIVESLIVGVIFVIFFVLMRNLRR